MQQFRGVVAAGALAATLALTGCSGSMSAEEARAGTEEVLADHGIDRLPDGVTPGTREAEDVQDCVTETMHQITVSLEVPADVDHVEAMAESWASVGEVSRSGGDAYVEVDGYTLIAIDQASDGQPALQAESPCFDDG